MSIIELENEEDTFQTAMTPMIDVVFLLIIFFMLVTQFSSQILEQNIVLPRASEAVADTGTDRMVINVDRSGTYTVMGVSYSLEELSSLLRSYKNRRLSLDSDSQIMIMVRADRGAAYKHIQDVYLMFQDNGIYQVQFAAEKEHE